jgi:hypothetical protein
VLTADKPKNHLHWKQEDVKAEINRLKMQLKQIERNEKELNPPKGRS